MLEYDVFSLSVLSKSAIFAADLIYLHMTMRKHPFSLFLLTITVLTLSACVDKLPDVISSEVTDSGTGGNVSVKTTTDKDGVQIQQLSYQSWIKVKGETKGGFDHTVTVNLTNELPDAAMEVERTFMVDALTLKKARTYSILSMRGEHNDKDADFVSVTDSVLVYGVDLDYFSFEYELMYEVPVYDDGVTKVKMPYYRYENIVDKGYTLEPHDAVVKGGIAYGCAIFHHEIDVTFNGKVYTLRANITLLKKLGSASQPYVVHSEINSNTAYVDDDGIRAVIGITKKWSTGEVTQEDYVIKEAGYAQKVLSPVSTVEDYQNDLEFTGISVVEDNVFQDVKDGDYVYYTSHQVKYAINYNYFSLVFEVIAGSAYYDDGTLMCTLLSNDIVSVQYLGETKVLINSGVNDDERQFVYYNIIASVDLQFANSSKKFDYEQPIVFLLH